MEELIGIKGEESLASIGFERQLVSMGHQASGALELWNYPLFFRDLVAQNVDGTPRPDHVDLAALEGTNLFYTYLCLHAWVIYSVSWFIIRVLN